MARKLLSAKQVAVLFGWNANTPWKKVAADPSFPKPVKLGPKCTRWDAAELDAWVEGKRAAA